MTGPATHPDSALQQVDRLVAGDLLRLPAWESGLGPWLNAFLSARQTIQAARTKHRGAGHPRATPPYTEPT